MQYGGAPIGALCARWTLGSTDDTLARRRGADDGGGGRGADGVGGDRAARAAGERAGASELLGVTPAMAELRQAVERAAAAPFAVLIEGESGSGKELVARASIAAGRGAIAPFCTLNCAALPDDLVEAELFGHARGAFTGAVAERAGVFEEAHGGTLFLDEIGELSPRAQAKVLRVIQEGELRRVGENVSRRVDVRIVAATNRDLRQEVDAGRFRLDLLYRLDVIRIAVPPLRDRREDIAVLAEHFWREATARVGSRATLARGDAGGARALRLAGQRARAAERAGGARRAQPEARRRAADGAAAARSASRGARRRLAARRGAPDVRGAVRARRAGANRRPSGRAAGELGVTRQGLTKLMTRLGIS